MHPVSRYTRRRFLSVSAIAATGFSLGGASAVTPVTHRFTDQALGADISLLLVHNDRQVAEAIAHAAFAEVGRLEKLFSLYRLDSTLVELNHQGSLRAPPAEMLSIFSVAEGVWRATEGTFDPTVQPHWPMRNQLAGKRQLFSWEDVHFSPSGIDFLREGMAITLNGIAQGFISEQLASLLRKHGLRDVLVNIGEIVALGKRADGRAWQVGVAQLQNDEPEQRIELSDKAIATSAPLLSVPSQRAAEAHIIDPATGRPCKSAWQRVSVIHPSAAIADALSTGLVMKDIDGIRKSLEYYPDAQVLLSDFDGQEYKITT